MISKVTRQQLSYTCQHMGPREEPVLPPTDTCSRCSLGSAALMPQAAALCIRWQSARKWAAGQAVAGFQVTTVKLPNNCAVYKLAHMCVLVFRDLFSLIERLSDRKRG